MEGKQFWRSEPLRERTEALEIIQTAPHGVVVAVGEDGKMHHQAWGDVSPFELIGLLFETSVRLFES